jgi:hypothetical protein
MAVVATRPFLGSRSIEDGAWARTTRDSLRLGVRGAGQLLFEGHLYQDLGLSPEDMLAAFRRNAPPLDLARFKGRYAAVYIPATGNALRAIQDHAGEGEIYERQVNDGAFLATNFADLCDATAPTEKELDDVAATSFRVVGCPIGERTLLQGARRLPPGAIASIDRNGLKLDPMWRYKRDHDDPFDQHTATEALDAALELAANRALRSSPGPRVAIGISGGLDSRVAAWYLKRAGAELTGYFFGETGTDSHRIAMEVAAALHVPLIPLGCNRTFPRFFSPLLESRPSADLEWAKYASARHKLDSADALASGYLGDHLFGSFVTLPAGGPDVSLARFTMARMFADECHPEARATVAKEVERLFREVGGSGVQRMNALWYRSRHMSIKNAPLFHDFDARPHLAVFADIDIIDLCLRLPRSALAGKSFYKQFILRKLPRLSTEHIPVPIGRSHKPIEIWLRDNSAFARAVRRLAPRPRTSMVVRDTTLNLHQVADAIVEGRLSRNEIHRFFRYFTIEAFIERRLASS